MYEYIARVVHIVDSDTLDLDIDMGFDVHVKQRLRIRDLHAPERFTDSGKQVTAFVETLLDNPLVTVQTKKTKSGEERDKYGRYVASVTLPDGRDYKVTVDAYMDAEGITDRGR